MGANHAHSHHVSDLWWDFPRSSFMRWAFGLISTLFIVGTSALAYMAAKNVRSDNRERFAATIDRVVDENGQECRNSMTCRGPIIESGGNQYPASDSPRLFDFHIGDKVTLVDAGDGLYSVSGLRFDWIAIPVAIIAIIAVILVSKMHGVRSIISLALSFGYIIGLGFPAIQAGFNPVLVMFLVCTSSIIVNSLITHGVNDKTVSSLIGTIIALSAGAFLSVVLLYNVSDVMSTTEESMRLDSMMPNAEVSYIIMASCTIAVLGLLNDVTISQASTAREIAKSGKPWKEVYDSSMKVGSDHIASAVYTLLMAYIGAGMVNILLVYAGASSIRSSIALPSLSYEIIQSSIGVICLALSMPLVTAISSITASAQEVDSGGEDLESGREDDIVSE